MRNFNVLNRDDLLNQVLKDENKYIVVLAGTGTGKTRIALKKVEGHRKVLIVHPRVIHKEEWKKEMVKWKLHPPYVDYSTYASLHKKAGYNKDYDYIIFDECHHLFGEKTFNKFSELVQNNRHIPMIFLSATVKRDDLVRLDMLLKGMHVYHYTMEEAIQNNELPKLTFIIHDFTPDNTKRSHIVCTKSGMNKPERTYRPGIIYSGPVRCTEKEAIELITEKIKYWAEQINSPSVGYNGNAFKRKNQARSLIKYWGLIRKSTLAKFKFERLYKVLPNIISGAQDKKILVFVDTIEQAEKLARDFGGDYIVSKKSNLKNKEILEKFNQDELKLLFCVGIPEEGVNIKAPDITVLLHLQRSNKNDPSRKVIQRIGRGVRSEQPQIHIVSLNTKTEIKDIDVLKNTYTTSTFKTIKYE